MIVLQQFPGDSWSSESWLPVEPNIHESKGAQITLMENTGQNYDTNEHLRAKTNTGQILDQKS